MLRSVLFTALIAFSASASAEFDYNYFSVGYSRVDYEDDFGDGADGDAFGVTGSYSLNVSFFIFGGFDTGDIEDDIGDSADLTLYNLGLGYHMPLSDNVDLIGSLSYEYSELSAFGLSIDENGFGVGLGLRAKAGDALELTGGVQHVDLDDFPGDGTFLELGAAFSISQNFQIGLNGSIGDDLSTYTLSGRYYFGD